ncbi:MAG: hypothetical protein M1822_001700 [Bathelium mastoideum]|nr:MAG: hypothetical protein M1822_001700 [Bathelium mastoideum]
MPTATFTGEGGDIFPEFSDGNVVIIIAPGYYLKLHVDHLIRSAERFKKLFAEGATSTNQIDAVYGALSKNTSFAKAPAPPPRKKAKKTEVTHYLVLGEVDEGDVQNGHGVLTPSTKDAILKNPSLFSTNSNAKIEPRYVRLWFNVLGSFYNAPLKLDQADLKPLLLDTIGMEAIATWLGCVPVLSYRIEHALFSKGDSLLRSIVNNPTAWIGLAWRLGAKDIYKEALIHLAGMFCKLKAQERALIPAEVLPKVEEKVALLEQFKANVDFRLATWLSPDLKPSGLPSGASSGQDHGRMAYADNIYTWIAQHLFDHFLKFAFQNGDNRGAADGGYEFYNCVYRGSTYLTKADLDRFHSGDCPMTPKGQRVLFNAVTDLKIQAKGLVRPLFTNSARIDREKEGLRHFTCVPVSDEELDRLFAAKEWTTEGSAAETNEETSETE